MDEQPLGELSFVIDGESFRQVMAWQEACDQAIIRHDLERRGAARVVRKGRRVALEEVRKLPKPGQAEPYYGPHGGGYRYTFEACEQAGALVRGCRLRVANLLLEREAGALPEYAALELSLGEGGEGAQPAAAAGDSAGSMGGEAGVDLDDPEVRRRLQAEFRRRERLPTELRFVIDPELLQRLAAWPRWGSVYGDYAFTFHPTRAGTAIQVTYLPLNETFELSEG